MWEHTISSTGGTIVQNMEHTLSSTGGTIVQNVEHTLSSTGGTIVQSVEHTLSSTGGTIVQSVEHTLSSTGGTIVQSVEHTLSSTGGTIVQSQIRLDPGLLRTNYVFLPKIGLNHESPCLLGYFAAANLFLSPSSSLMNPSMSSSTHQHIQNCLVIFFRLGGSGAQSSLKTCSSLVVLAFPVLSEAAILIRADNPSRRRLRAIDGVVEDQRAGVVTARALMGPGRTLEGSINRIRQHSTSTTSPEMDRTGGWPDRDGHPSTFLGSNATIKVRNGELRILLRLGEIMQYSFGL
ncbi:hypothetical protein EGW08_017544 [Elysia chlorotica]|uniref:Uncharacterized protein n=1 Tax=Elysia chlorotica TaxID=188477 RepID=A0A3S0ZT71_ELYCH|nr:hypothetical protein EGW08_017544 [Elysia chlorotica]